MNEGITMKLKLSTDERQAVYDLGFEDAITARYKLMVTNGFACFIVGCVIGCIVGIGV